MAINLKDIVKQASNKANEGLKNVKEKTKEYISEKAPIVKENVKIFANKIVDTSKNIGNSVSNKANEVIQDIKDYQEEKKEELKIESLENLKEILSEMNNHQAINFINELDEERKILSNKRKNKIIKTFPIPVEQNILWADVELDLRPSGIAITDKGIFIKTDVTVIDEKFKKDENGNKIQSNLIFCSWNNFDPKIFTNGNLLEQVSGENKFAFVNTCNKIVTAASVVGANASLSLDAKTVAYNAYVKNDSRFGFLVEDYLTKMDKLNFKASKVVGNDLKTSGPDRQVNGQYIQTKYHRTAESTLGAAFDSEGNYRYVGEDNIKYQFEVPYEQYNEIKSSFKEKVRNGEVPNIKDEAQVDEIVKQGLLTHEQGVNLAKAGTIDSLKYDALTGSVMCLSVLGLSFVTSAFFTFLATKDIKYAVKEGLICATKSYGLSVLTYVATAQFMRTSLGNQMARSMWLTNGMKEGTVKNLSSATRLIAGKEEIAKESIKSLRKELATTLNSTIISSLISFTVFSIPETIKLCTRKISVSQYAKNLVKLGAGIVGGAVGSITAGSIAATAGVTGAAGVAVGVVGSMTGAFAVGAAVGVVADVLVEDDIIRYSRLFNAYVSHYVNEYMLIESEIDILLKKLGNVDGKEFTKFFEKVHASKKQEQTIKKFLTPYFEEIVTNREKFSLNDEQAIELAFA